MFKVILATAVTLAAAGTLATIEASAPPAPLDAIAQQDSSRAGRVMGTTRDTIMLMDEVNNDMFTFEVNAQTRVTLNGKLASVADIQMGDHATVSGRFINNKLTARTVEAHSRR